MSHPRCDRTVAWQALQARMQGGAGTQDLRELFASEPDRVERLGIEAPEIFADLSRVHWDIGTWHQLLDLARECGLEARRDALLAGAKVNATEGRAALHTALRAPRGQGPFSEQVHEVLDRMLAFADAVHTSSDGSLPAAITDIVHIGIGGSDLGPQMAVAALDTFVRPDLRLHFVSNVDGQALLRVLRDLKPQHTLFVVASKTFTTQETMVNAHTARQWFIDQGGQDIARHFVGTTTNVAAAAAFGITRTFGFWDWVGGRFSMWSAIGLPIALAIGSANFRALLAGAHDMDVHFAQAPLARNLPMLLGLLDVWYRDFRGYASRCVAPYHQGLHRLPAYLQQLVMESNGKRVDMAGEPLPFGSSDVVWGEPGTNGQHAFFQMLHQGTDVIPVEFILVKQPSYRATSALTPEVAGQLRAQHALLLSNGLAQAQALMWGKDEATARRESVPTASPDFSPEVLARHRTFPGNRPSFTLLMDELTPRSLGALIALQEHRTFVAGALWGINSFDQWGVELGKALCQDLLPRLQSGDVTGLDPATAALIRRLQ